MLHPILDRVETPPRAWGRRVRNSLCLRCPRNTPTGVGKTPKVLLSATHEQKHPHGRGEDVLQGLRKYRNMETPPRAWGRHRSVRLLKTQIGNTPTGVGKTAEGAGLGKGDGKHPHGRGEDQAELRTLFHKMETPPRAWGRHAPTARAASPYRNTPTGVGKTFAVGSLVCPSKKHPHGRGEDLAGY